MRRGVLIGLAVLGVGTLGSRGEAQVLPKYSEPVEGAPVMRPAEQPTKEGPAPSVKPATKEAPAPPVKPATKEGPAPPVKPATKEGSAPPVKPATKEAPAPPAKPATKEGSTPPAEPPAKVDGSATAVRLPLDTRDGRITLSVAPAAPVLGRQSEVSVTFTVLDRNGTAVPSADLVLTSSVGRFAELHSLEDGRYTAAFLPPTTRFPQVALCSVLDRRHPALGALFAIPLTGTTRLPIQSSQGLSLEFDVAGRTFGPFASDESGTVQAELEVPPGTGQVRVTAHRKANGSDKIEGEPQWLNLPTPAFVRVKLLTLPPLVADGETGTLVQALVVDAAGMPLLGAQVEMSAALGVITPPTEVGEGLYRARYTPPRLTGSRIDTIIVRLPQGGPEQQEKLSVTLLPVAPAATPPKRLTVPAGEQWVAPPERPLQPIAVPSGSENR